MRDLVVYIWRGNALPYRFGNDAVCFLEATRENNDNGVIGDVKVRISDLRRCFADGAERVGDEEGLRTAFPGAEIFPLGRDRVAPF